MSMRYGKVYFYDRMGNRLKHQVPLGREDESISAMFQSPQRGNLKISGGFPLSSSTSMSQAFHPDYPFKPNFMALEESEMDFAEGGAENPSLVNGEYASGKKSKDENPWDALGMGMEDELNYRIVSPKKIKPIISPLNSLRSPPDINDMEQDRLAKELARIDMKTNKELDEREWDSQIKDFHIRHSIREDSSSLCSVCRLEESAVEDSRELSTLRKRLAEHVDEVNFEEKQQHEYDHEREQKEKEKGSAVLPAFDREINEDMEKEKEQMERERYRDELEVQIENKRRLSEFEEDKEKKMQNLANTLDAQKYAEDQEHQKTLEMIDKHKHFEDLREQIEINDFIRKKDELKQEWWERKPPYMFSESDDLNKSRVFEQLRRNEALKESVGMLEMFKKQQIEQDEQSRQAHQKQIHYMKHALQQQTSLISHGSGKRPLAEPTNPDVYRAWEEAHRKNDRRYRVLQEVDTSGVVGVTATSVTGARRGVGAPLMPSLHYKETVVERKRCRKCHRPMREKKYTHTIDASPALL